MSKTLRLAKFFKPSNYQLFISIDNNFKKFDGKTTVVGKIGESTKSIYFHLNGPKIKTAKIADQVLEVDYDEDSQLIELSLPDTVNKDTQLKIEFEFSGQLSQTMEGMYRSVYDEDGTKKTLVSTQFESTHAREVFPCIDEPDAKATFDLSLETPICETILANTPIKSQEKIGDRLKTEFDPSPKMSSYLLAWVIGDLAKKSAETKSSTKVNVYATKASSAQLNFSMDVAVKVLEFFEEYFDIKYPLAKLDMVAIPEFAAGAMENWGLVTYRETAMLFDEQHSSLPTKRRVIEVVAHELAHQWFGNLVTMKWWDDLWLNESFATFMSFMCAEKLYPELGFDELFMEDEYFPALHADSNSKTTSIYAPLENPKDINEHFDPAITYGKGAAVLRMLHNYIGDEAFRAGLHNYLENKQYANAVGQDLWNSLKKSSGKPVDDFMQKWIKQPGYPLISFNDGKLLQERYYEQSDGSKSSDATWPVKLTPATEFSTKSTTISLRGKLNPGQYGVYRCHYQPDYLAKLTNSIANSDWQNTDLMGLLDDTTSLAKAGLTSTDSLLELISKYNDFSSDSVWDIVFSSISSISSVFGNDELRQNLDKFATQLVSSQYNRLGWKQPKDESSFDSLLRPTILALACKHRLPDAIENANNLYYSYINDKIELNPNLRSIIYATVAKNGDSSTFDQLYKMYKKAGSAEEKRRFAGALCSFEDIQQIEKAINLIDSESVRKQEVVSWIFGLYQNRHSREYIWQWQQKNWDWIQQNFGRGHLYSYFVMGLASFTEDKFINEINSFYAKKDLSGIKRTLEQSLEKISIKSAWKNRDYDKVKKYLQTFNQ